MEPGEPGIAHEEFEEMVWGLDCAHSFFITNAVVIDEGFVEMDEGVPDFR
jgi:hypothetical protein